MPLLWLSHEGVEDMRSITRHTLDVNNVQTLRVPLNSTVLSVQLCDRGICLWIEHDPPGQSQVTVKRYFRTFRTGEEMQKGGGYKDTYVGTVIKDGVDLHVYEVIDRG